MAQASGFEGHEQWWRLTGGAHVERPNLNYSCHMTDIGSDLQSASGEREYIFEEASRLFWLRMDPERWVSLSEGQIRRELKFQGFRDKADPTKDQTLLAPLDGKIREVEQDKRVAFACALAGHKAGICRVGGKPFLVTESPQLIVPQKGEFPKVAKFWEGLLTGTDEGNETIVDQRAHFFTWLRVWLKSLYGGYVTRGPCLGIAGEPECGKTLSTMLLKAMTGGRVAKPYDFMIGRDDFNKDMFEATLQLIDDESADTGIEARKELGAQIKKFVANVDVKLRGMHRDGITVEPNWRLIILTNLEAEALLVFPPISNDLRDKMLMLKGYSRPAPGSAATEAERSAFHLPVGNVEEKAAYVRAMEAELPAFIWWLLNEFEAPAHVAHGRFGVAAWQHPQILSELQQFSPHVRMWQLIHKAGVVFRETKNSDNPDEPQHTVELEHRDVTPRQLHDMLTGESSQLTALEIKEVKAPNWLGQLLKAAAAHWGATAVEARRTGAARTWRLHRRPDLAE